MRIHDMLMHKIKNPHRYNKIEEVCSISFEDCGYIEAPGGFLHKKRFLEQYELIYVSKGTLYIRLDHQQVILSKNSLMILPPYKTVEGFHQSTHATAFYYVNFTTDNPNYFNICGGKVQLNHSPDFIERLERLHKGKISIYAPDYVKDADLLVLLHEIHQQSGSGSESSKLALLFRQCVAQNISKPLTADYISAQLQYNKDYLCKVVKKHFGVSLKDYIIRQKLDLAKKLLITSNYSVGEIANLVGYPDANLFTKFFSYHMKQSPQNYRYNHIL